MGDDIPLNGRAGAVYEVFKTHRSIRRYKREPVREEHARLILEAARRAPTDASMHLWSAVWVRSQEVKDRIAAAIGQEHVSQAGMFLVFNADLYRVYRVLEYRGLEPARDDTALLIFAAIDASLAAENAAVMAEALGYGTCFIGAVQNAADRIIEWLGLPRHVYPLFGLTIGVPDEDPPVRPRLPLEYLVHEDRYRDYSEGDLEAMLETMKTITRRRDWSRVLARYASSQGYFSERSRILLELLKRQGFRLPVTTDRGP